MKCLVGESEEMLDRQSAVIRKGHVGVERGGKFLLSLCVSARDDDDDDDDAASSVSFFFMGS